MPETELEEKMTKLGFIGTSFDFDNNEVVIEKLRLLHELLKKAFARYKVKVPNEGPKPLIDILIRSSRKTLSSIQNKFGTSDYDVWAPEDRRGTGYMIILFKYYNRVKNELLHQITIYSSDFENDNTELLSALKYTVNYIKFHRLNLNVSEKVKKFLRDFTIVD